MKKLLIFSALIICWSYSFSQTSPTNINSSSPPSNTASSVGGKSGDYDINLYTGHLSYNITLSTYRLSNIDIPIGLSYNAGGIKVQDQPGISGTGWSLNAGGLISRYVQSVPDEDANGYCGTNNLGNRLYGALDTPYFNKIIDGTYDSEPDRFVISFLNHTATFVLNKDGIPVFSSSSGLKVEYCPFSRIGGRMSGGAEKWLIRDREDNLFIFGDGATELTNATNHGRSKDKSKSYISSWYLKKIVTADFQEINFTYNSVPAHNFTIYTNVYVPPLTASGSCTTPDFSGNSWSENTDVNIPAPLYLKKISSSIFEINFNCDNNPYLNEITASQNGIIEHDFIFNYTSTPSGRSLLSSIEQKAVNNARQYVYIFNYNKSESLPTTNSIQTDFWGYYNANPGSSNIQGYLNGDKSPNLARTAAMF